MGHPVSYFQHNWLIMKIGNKLITQNLSYLKGVVYDLGCGERPYENEILNVADKYIGVDWSDTFHNLKADIIADLNKTLPIDSEVADSVTSFQVMEHLSEPQIFLKEAHRILKVGGYLVLTIPFQWWVHEAPYDYYRYTPYGLKYLFEKAGFINIVVKPQAGFFTTAVLKWNYFTSRFVRGPKTIRWIIKSGLLPFWFIGQKLAPLLDNLDFDWELETSGYYVTANKPKL